MSRDVWYDFESNARHRVAERRRPTQTIGRQT